MHEQVDILHAPDVRIGIDGKGGGKALEVDDTDSGLLDQLRPFERGVAAEPVQKNAALDLLRID